MFVQNTAQAYTRVSQSVRHAPAGVRVGPVGGTSHLYERHLFLKKYKCKIKYIFWQALSLVEI
jgi:hypothetical protein